MDIRQLLERSDRPFASHPQVERFFASAPMEEARQRLGRTIQRGDGLGVVIGPAGTGKSLLLQVLAAQHHSQFDVVLLACAQLCTRRALLQAILFELGQEYRLRDEGELRLSLLDQLLSDERDSTGLLLLVDEAQLLPARLLEELRMLTNVVQGGVPRVRLVLAGMPVLEEVLAGPELESFNQRVVARCYLAPFTRDETMQYGRAQIAASGGDPDRLFAPDAWHAVFDATDGVPRLVNQLCGSAMWLADAQQTAKIDRGIIQAAWSDLQQLPTPWESEPAAPAETGSQDVVEFGGLDDDQSAQVSVDFDAPDNNAVDSWKDAAAESGWNTEPVATATDRLASSPGLSNVATRTTASDLGQTKAEIGEPVEAPTPKKHDTRRERATESSETADPFGEPFDEEEVVLDNFATWDSANYRQAPRVENRRDRGFSTLVGQALDTSAVEAVKPNRTPAPPAPTAADPQQPQIDDSKSPRSRVRLAVVSEPAPLRPIPVVKTPEAETEEGPRTAKVERTPVHCDSGDPTRTADTQASADEVDILVVEDHPDETTDVEYFGKSDKFQRLLARLRGD